jgi:hypothetical protein
MDDSDVPDNDRLARLWREGRRRAVISFLQRAVTPDSTLQDVFDALSYPEVREHLVSAKLRDVLTPERTPPSVERTAVRGKAAPPKAGPRCAEQTQQMRDHLLERLAEAPEDGATTSELWAALRDAGLETASVVVAQLLKGLEAAGQVRDCGGRPIIWKLEH